jgi:hypothetical protein
MMYMYAHSEAATFKNSGKIRNRSVKSSRSIADFTPLFNFRNTKLEDSLNLSNTPLLRAQADLSNLYIV